MNSRILRLLLFLVSAASLSCTRGPADGEGAGAGSARLAAGTSLLLVTLDTTRADFVSPYGADPRITPNLGKLAESGALFLNAYAQTNVTNPSHISILTGLRAVRHGVFHNAVTLPEDLDTLPEAFQRAGFETAAFPASQHVGEDLGWRGFDRLEPARGEITAEEVTNRILGWLGARDGSRPFFAWLHYWDPHTPYAPPGAVASAFYAGDPFSGDRRLADRPFLQKTHVGKDLMKWLGERRDPEYPSAMYAAEVHFVDRELGRVLRLLEERSLAERTVIVVVGDHGESLGEHEIFYNHIGLYETQLRVPLIVRVPGLPAGVRSATPVTHLDLAPTLAELFGVSLRHRPEGSSLVRLLAGNPAPDLEGDRRLVHEHAYNHQVALRSGVWKLIWPITRKTKNPALIGEPALYDLTTDPNERHDLASERPEVVAELAASLRAWTHVGRVPNGHDPKLNRAAVDRLRALGYLQ